LFEETIAVYSLYNVCKMQSLFIKAGGRPKYNYLKAKAVPPQATKALGGEYTSYLFSISVLDGGE
jgi:hypothetical protein